MEVSRVLLDVRPLQGPSSRRGIGTYLRGLLGGLVAEGFDSRLAVLVDRSLPMPELPSARLVAYRIRRRWHGQLAAYEDAVRLPAELERIRPALYHATTLSLPGRSPCLLAVTLHDLIPWALGGRRLLGERLRFRLAPRLLRRADLVLAVSAATAADATRIAGVPETRIRVVPEAPAASLGPREGAAERVAARFGLRGAYFVYLGALDVRKDPDALLRAWRAATASGIQAQLVLAGEPGAQAPASMDGAVTLGHLPEDQLADLLSAASCLIFPSRYEGFGLPLLEAMACGCPAVAFDNSSLREVTGRAAVLVPDGDAEALGRAAADLVRDGRRRATLRRAGLAQARRFTWHRAARETVAAWQSLLPQLRP